MQFWDSSALLPLVVTQRTLSGACRALFEQTFHLEVPARDGPYTLNLRIRQRDGPRFDAANAVDVPLVVTRSQN